MSKKESLPPDFKVSDRRSFHSDGSPKEKEMNTPEPEAPSGPTITEGSLKADSTETLPKSKSPEPVSFIGLVYSLSTTAMFQLGVMGSSDGGENLTDLPGARQTIDILNILKEKTSGNLTSTESTLLTNTLYELRMACVAVEKRKANDDTSKEK